MNQLFKVYRGHKNTHREIMTHARIFAMTYQSVTRGNFQLFRNFESAGKHTTEKRNVSE